MIKQLALNTGHNYRLSKLPIELQKQYNEILTNIESEETEYMVGVDLANPNSNDYSVISKFRYIDGMLKLICTETLGELPCDIKLGDGEIEGKGYYESNNKIEFENGSAIESIETTGDNVRGKRSKIVGIY